MDLPTIIAGAMIADDSALHAAHGSPEIPEERQEVVDSNLCSNVTVGANGLNAIAQTASSGGASPNSRSEDTALRAATLTAATASELVTDNDAKPMRKCVKCGELPAARFQRDRKRCDDCLAADRRYQQKQRAMRRFRKVVVELDLVHELDRCFMEDE